MERTIRRVESSEVDALSTFAEACFRESFSHDFPALSMDRLCKRVFAIPIMVGLIRKGVWISVGQNEWQGYIAMGRTPCPILELTHPVVELARLYVPARWQGQGVADGLMQRFLAEAGSRKGKSVWLQAYDRNPRALAFYRRWGFVDHGGYDVECEGIYLPHRAMGRKLIPG